MVQHVPICLKSYKDPPGPDRLLSGFYRSAQPSELNFSFLEKLNLRSVIWVGAEEPSEIL